jgi:hypothetical protein
MRGTSEPTQVGVRVETTQGHQASAYNVNSGQRTRALYATERLCTGVGSACGLRSASWCCGVLWRSRVLVPWTLSCEDAKQELQKLCSTGQRDTLPLVVIGLIILDRRGLLQDKALRMLSDKQANPRHCLRPLLPTFLALACRQVLACGSMAFLPSSRDRVIGELVQFIFRTNERSKR